MLMAGLLVGCTNVNRALNPANVALEHRELNTTLAATGARAAAHLQSMRVAVRPLPPYYGLARAWDRTWLGDQQTSDDDGIFVGMALSGGGSRSANFAAACMFQLQKRGILQKADYISAVSGGAVTAAYYCTHDAEWNPAEAQRRLTYSFANDIIVNTLLPWNMFALTFTTYDRGDLLAASFQRHLYSRGGRGLTFGDLRADRPRLLINATNLQSGRRFVFSNESFDQLNSDLSRYPIANAVAASSAVPVLIHHETLRDYSTIFKQYVHLVDGGIDDNLGIKTLIETYEAHQEAARTAGGRSPYPNGAVIIVIDARTTYDADLSDKGDIGLLDSIAIGAGLASTQLLERASSATLAETIVQYSPDDVTAAELREQIRVLEATGYIELRDREQRPVTVLHIALPRVDALSDQPFESFRSRVNSIATYFNISATEAYHLYLAADLLCNELFDEELNRIRRRIDR